MVDTKCDICGSSERDFLFAAVDCNWSGKGPFSIFACGRCGLAYLAPRPDEADFFKCYPEIYYSGKEAGASHKMRLIKKWAQPAGSVLDVGCGKGYFLNQMKRSGWMVRGLELSEKEADFAKKTFDIDVYTKGLVGSDLSGIRFDLVTFWHSLEHIKDPSSFLKQVYRILKPKGCLIISTPNISSLQANVFGKKWYHIDAPRHLNLFSAKSLGLLLEKNAFSVRKVNYFDFGHNLFGWVMSALNLFNLSQGRLIKLKKKKTFGIRLALLLSRCLKLLLFFLALPIVFIESLFPFSGTLEVLAIKEGK